MRLVPRVLPVLLALVCAGASSAQVDGGVLALVIPADTVARPSLNDLSGPVATYTLTPEAPFVDVALVDNDGFAFAPRAEGAADVVLEYCDADGNCASVAYALSARLPREISAVTVRDTVTAPGPAYTYCVDTAELPGVVRAPVDVCEEENGFADIQLDAATYCVKYRGLTVGGSDTACVVVCDDLGFCDTTTVIITTVEPNEYSDRDYRYCVAVGQERTIALDLSDFDAPAVGARNTCAELSGNFVDYSVAEGTYEVTFGGLAEGQEDACVAVKDAAGDVQLHRITVTAYAQTDAVDTVRVRNGETYTWCFGPAELPTCDAAGTPTELSDACAAAGSPAAISFPEGGTTTCAEFSGVRLGTQEACMTLCDADGNCDRVFLTIEVIPGDDDRLPDAVDDGYVYPGGGLATLDVTDNDSSLTAILALRLIDLPTLGRATVNLGDLTIGYESASGTCGPDSLRYEICNEYGCDQAVVRLACENGGLPPLIVRNGVSPNGDDLSDTWVIRNIEYYPENYVQIFNRWGTRLYEMHNYDNSWRGTYAEDIPLPDGTYFYLLDAGDGREPLAGYVQLRR